MVYNIFETNLVQIFSYILTCKTNWKTNNYNKSKNKELIILIMKFKKYNI